MMCKLRVAQLSLINPIKTRVNYPALALANFDYSPVTEVALRIVQIAKQTRSSRPDHRSTSCISFPIKELRKATMGSYYKQTDKLVQVKTGCDLWGLRQTPGKFLIKVLVFYGRVNNAISV